jgi:hypothetical protein
MHRADCARMQTTDSVVGQLGTSLAGRPEFYRLPRGSGGDPFFHLTRTFYYEGEKRGYWRLARIRERGKLRGVTLVPYDAVAAFVRSQIGAQ